jgi:hypothetical protein
MPTTHVWNGDALPVAQVDSFTPANVETTDIFTLTCNGRSVSFTATAATVANVTAGLTTAWNASTEVEHTELTASDQTTYMDLTSDTAGVPFTVTASTTDGGGTDDQTLTRAAVTANAGPNVWAADNFDSGTLPANTDTVIFENSNVDCLYGLDQNAVTLTLLTIRQSYTGKIGLPRTNATNSYVEYRDTFLKISATTVDIGEGEGNGSGRIKVNVGSNQTAVNIYNQGTRAETGIPCVLWQGTHASNTFNLVKGDAGVAFFGGETSTIATLQVGYISNQSSDSELLCGSGTTLTTVTVNGGEVDLDSNVTTLNQTAGDVTLRSAATVTTWNLDGGTAYHASTGTLTTLNVGGGAIFDCRRSLGARTITNANLYQGATINDPMKTVTFTNGLDLVRCSPGDVTLDIGEHQTLTPSAI